MATVIYPLGRGGNWNDNQELMYSLRSLQKYAKNVDRVVVITDQELKWIKDVEIVPYVELSNKSYKNQWLKLDIICGQEAEPFVYMNDDFILNKPFDMNDVQVSMFHDTLTELAPKCNEKGYGQQLLNTVEELNKRGYKDFNYGMHNPMVIDPTLWRSVMSKFDKKIPICYKSIYGSVVHKGYGVLTTDCKINRRVNKTGEIEKKIKDSLWFSTSDSFMASTHGRVYLQTHYSYKSRWEK